MDIAWCSPCKLLDAWGGDGSSCKGGIERKSENYWSCYRIHSCNYVTIDHRSEETGRDIPLETLISNTRYKWSEKNHCTNLIISVSVSSLSIDKSADESRVPIISLKIAQSAGSRKYLSLNLNFTRGGPLFQHYSSRLRKNRLIRAFVRSHYRTTNLCCNYKLHASIRRP